MSLPPSKKSRKHVPSALLVTTLFHDDMQRPTSPKSPALVTINSAESQDDQQSPEELNNTTERSSDPRDATKNAADIELLEGLCQHLWTSINERDWFSLGITPSTEASPAASPSDLARYSSHGSVTTPSSYRSEASSSLRDPDFLATWIAPKFTAELNNREIAASFQDYMRLQRWISEQHPQYNVEVTEVSTELDMRHGWANVLVFADVTGYPVGVSRQVLVMFKWKRSERQWWCSKMSTLRGGGRYDHCQLCGCCSRRGLRFLSSDDPPGSGSWPSSPALSRTNSISG